MLSRLKLKLNYVVRVPHVSMLQLSWFCWNRSRSVRIVRAVPFKSVGRRNGRFFEGGRGQILDYFIPLDYIWFLVGWGFKFLIIFGSSPPPPPPTHTLFLCVVIWFVLGISSMVCVGRAVAAATHTRPRTRNKRRWTTTPMSASTSSSGPAPTLKNAGMYLTLGQCWGYLCTKGKLIYFI